MMLAAALVAACGSHQGLSGDLPTRIVWHGSWSAEDRSAIVDYINGLAPAGYFSGLSHRGLNPVYRVVEDGPVRAVADFYAEDAPVKREPREALACHDVLVPGVSVHLTIYPSSDWEAAAFAVAHELVEAATDPWLDDLSGSEVADPCVFQGYAELPRLPGSFKRAPRYLVNGACWPFDGGRDGG